MTIENPNEILHYDEIPDFVFKENITILDVGCGNGYGAFYSRHKYHFLQNEYLGVDVQSFDNHYLDTIITAEFSSFETEKRFDVIVFSHILEHFEIERWAEVLNKLVSLLSVHGYLVINVPFASDGLGGKEGWMRHKVFQIDEKLLSQFLHFHSFYRVGKKPHPIVFRDSGESIVWASLRFIGRILTNHKYSAVKRYFASPARLVAVYQKEMLE